MMISDQDIDSQAARVADAVDTGNSVINSDDQTGCEIAAQIDNLRCKSIAEFKSVLSEWEVEPARC